MTVHRIADGAITATGHPSPRRMAANRGREWLALSWQIKRSVRPAHGIMSPRHVTLVNIVHAAVGPRGIVYRRPIFESRPVSETLLPGRAVSCLRRREESHYVDGHLEISVSLGESACLHSGGLLTDAFQEASGHTGLDMQACCSRKLPSAPTDFCVMVG
eukprot:scaffold233907_cov36-Tisochrysis_lutea.AAC.2